MRLSVFYSSFLFLAFLLTGCGSSSNAAVSEAQAALTTDRSSLTVFAAASLTEAFTEIAAEFQKDHPQVNVLLNFAGSQSLRLQIEQGASADVFASANIKHAEAVFQANLIEPPVIFTHNHLVVVVPAANPAGIETLADLARPDLKLVLAGPEVPAGRYARQVLEILNTDPRLGPDFSVRVLANLVSEEDTVKGVVAKVQLGEADAGFVYTSDVTPAVADRLLTMSIPPEYGLVADYPIAVVSDSSQPKLAQQFISFVLSPQGQMIMVEHGFQPLEELYKPVDNE